MDYFNYTNLLFTNRKDDHALGEKVKLLCPIFHPFICSGFVIHHGISVCIWLLWTAVMKKFFTRISYFKLHEVWLPCQLSVEMRWKDMHVISVLVFQFVFGHPVQVKANNGIIHKFVHFQGCIVMQGNTRSNWKNLINYK